MSDLKSAEKMMKNWNRALKKGKRLNQLHLRKKFKAAKSLLNINFKIKAVNLYNLP